MSAVDDAPDCVCGDPRCEHKRGTGGCRNPECGCGKYVASGVGGIVESIGPFDPGNGCVLPVSSVIDVAALLAEAQADADREAELAARLAEVERERDANMRASADAARKLIAERDGAAEQWAKAREEIERLRTELNTQQERHRYTWDLERNACVKLRSERDLARANLDRALLQLAEVAADRDSEPAEVGRLTALLTEARESVARGERHEEIRAQVIRERNAQRAAHEKRIAELEVLLEHAEQHSRDLQDNGVVLGDVLSSYDAWLCATCGRRYTRETAAVDHACGPMQPVTVTVSRRPAQDTTTENRSTTE